MAEYQLQPSPLFRKSKNITPIGISGLLFSPEITFATPGDLSVTYSFNSGTFYRQGSWVHSVFTIHTNSFTHSTASGALRITGFPLPNRPTETSGEPLYGGFFIAFQGITLANYTQFAPEMESQQSYCIVRGSGSGQNRIAVQASHVPTGGDVILDGNIWYQVSEFS
jgi:hypothetical protein